MPEKSDLLRMLMEFRSVRYPKCRLIYARIREKRNGEMESDIWNDFEH